MRKQALSAVNVHDVPIWNVDEVRQEELVAMRAEDLRVREELLKTGELGNGYAPKMEAVHRKNAARLKKPISRRFGIGGERHASDFEIVGVVGNAKYDSPREELMPMAFLPLPNGEASQSGSSDDESNVIEVRSSSAHPETVTAEVRHALAEIAPGLPVLRLSTLSENIKLMLNQENVIAALAIFF